jgi:hypothetical protein
MEKGKIPKKNRMKKMSERKGMYSREREQDETKKQKKKQTQ